MFERYTEKARQAIFFASEEAQKAGAEEIGTEHLLLGLTLNSADLVRRFVGEGATLEVLRAEIEYMSPPTNKTKSPELDAPLSNQSKRVLAFAEEEAERLGSRIITPGHLLLGLMREKDCVAERALRKLGAKLKTMRKTMGAANGSKD